MAQQMPREADVLNQPKEPWKKSLLEITKF